MNKKIKTLLVFLLFLGSIYYISLAVVKKINSSESQCNIDSDCIFYRPYPYCGEIVINKQEIGIRKLEDRLDKANPLTFFSLLINFNRACFSTPLEISFVPHCNNNRCDKKRIIVIEDDS